jgi:hypothetical protein
MPTTDRATQSQIAHSGLGSPLRRPKPATEQHLGRPRRHDAVCRDVRADPADVIEPWDNYIPKEILNDIIPSIRNECTVNGQLYSWPFLLDIITMGWNKGQSDQAGITDMPTTWDQLLADGQQIVSSKAAPYGVVFDAHGWRSLASITLQHSTSVYTPDLLRLQQRSALQALEIMKQMLAVSAPTS